MAVGKRSTIAALEYGYVALSLFLISDALTPILYPGGEDLAGADDSNPARLALAVVLYGIGLVILMRHVKTALAVLARRPELIILVLWTLLSVFWSGSVGPVGRRAIAHFLTVTFCLMLAIRMPRREFLDQLLVVTILGGIVSVVLCVAVPSISVHHGGGLDGAWHGVYPHKAIAGRVAVLGILLALLVRPEGRLARAIRWPGLLVLCGFLAMTQSRAAWLGVIGCLGVYGMMKVFLFDRIERRLRITAGIFTIVGGIVVGAVGFVFVLSEMGRDLTFSGRTVLWNAAIHVAQEHNTLIGVGYKNFWLGASVNQVLPYIASWSKTPGHGHNGYLDIWLELGWIGSFLFAVFVVRTIVALIKMQARRPKDPSRAFLFLAFLQFLAANAGATVALTHTDLLWSMALLGSLYSAKDELKFAAIARRREVRSIRSFMRRSGSLSPVSASHAKQGVPTLEI
jgi:O-antigen ligase